MYYIYGRVRAIPTYRVYRLYDNYSVIQVSSKIILQYEMRTRFLEELKTEVATSLLSFLMQIGGVSYY